MIKNWRATAYLTSPLAGEPSSLDALLQWEMALRLGKKHHAKLTRAVPLSRIPYIPIPLSKRTISGHDVYCCSDPIIPGHRCDCVDRIAKHLDVADIAPLLSPKERRAISTNSGPYKSRYAPVRVRLIDRIVWFFRGDKHEVRRILKSVYYIGKYGRIGYGVVSGWEYEDMGENDFSIFAPTEEGRVLMKTIPNGPEIRDVVGYRVSFGGGVPPYWHPDNYMEIAVPC